jgi:hypothetical protein
MDDASPAVSSNAPVHRMASFEAVDGRLSGLSCASISAPDIQHFLLTTDSMEAEMWAHDNTEGRHASTGPAVDLDINFSLGTMSNVGLGNPSAVAPGGRALPSSHQGGRVTFAPTVTVSEPVVSTGGAYLGGRGGGGGGGSAITRGSLDELYPAISKNIASITRDVPSSKAGHAGDGTIAGDLDEIRRSSQPVRL